MATVVHFARSVGAISRCGRRVIHSVTRCRVVCVAGQPDVSLVTTDGEETNPFAAPKELTEWVESQKLIDLDLKTLDGYRESPLAFACSTPVALAANPVPPSVCSSLPWLQMAQHRLLCPPGPAPLAVVQLEKKYQDKLIVTFKEAEEQSNDRQIQMLGPWHARLSIRPTALPRWEKPRRDAH